MSAPPATPPSLSSPTAEPSLSKQAAKRQRRKAHKLAQNQPEVQQPQPKSRARFVPTLPALEDATRRALCAIPKASLKYPEDAAALRLAAKRTVREDTDDEDLGKSHLAYAILIVLRRRLPPQVLSRGSLTIIRGVIISRAGLETLTNSFYHPPALSRLRKKHLFHLYVGLLSKLSTSSAVVQFLSKVLSSVMEKVSTEALSLDSLYDDRIEDETRQILLKVQAATSEGLLGTRVLSKEDKENVPSSSGNRETQPKRRTSDLLQPILQTLPTSLVQNNQPTEEDGADLLDDTHEENEVALALAAIGDSSEDGQSEDGPAVPLQRAIQNSIVIACTKLRCSLSFGDIPHEGWDLILGHFSGRDPIETIGDAAMCVVLIEMIIERLAGVDQGVEIRKAIIGPMLSNSTFLHILCNADYFRQSSKNKIEPKFPGNAFEVLAGAVALFRSLEELKVALRPTLDPLLEASIEAWTESQNNLPREVKEKARKRSDEEEKSKRGKRRKVAENIPRGSRRVPRQKQKTATIHTTTHSLPSFSRPKPSSPDPSTSKIGNTVQKSLTMCSPDAAFSFRVPTDLAWDLIPETAPSQPALVATPFIFKFNPLDWLARMWQR